MPSRRFRWLAAKEFRELMASRAFWLLLLMIGPLVGHGFITAVDTYAEASGIAGGPSALAQGLSPLDGILVPAFGAYDLAVTLLFPFVAIRLVAVEKASGAWKLLLQSPASSGTMLFVKGLMLLAGWLIAWIPGLCALVLWRLYGGTLYAPEVLNLLLGHLLRFVLASGIAVAAAAIASGAASAAIATLGFTVGTWALEFVAAGRGGLLQKVASYTPNAALRLFEQGQLRLATVVITAAIGVAGFALAAIWLQQGRTIRARSLASVATLLLFALTAVSAGRSAPRVGPEREPPQQLFRRRRGRSRPHPSASARHRLPRCRKTRACSIWTATFSPNSRASCLMSRSSMPPAPAPDSSKPPATITAKSGTSSGAANP